MRYIPSPGEHGEGEVAAGCAEALESFTKKEKKRKNAQKMAFDKTCEGRCLFVGIFARSLGFKRGETAS